MLLLGIVIGIIGTYAVLLVVALFLAQLLKHEEPVDVEEPAQQWRWN